MQGDNPKRFIESIFFRSLLLKTLIDEINNPKVIFNQDLSSKWAIDSIKRCKKIYDLDEIDFVIGSDLITEIFSWKNFDKILKEVNLLVIEREGYPIDSQSLEMLKKSQGALQSLFSEYPQYF